MNKNIYFIVLIVLVLCLGGFVLFRDYSIKNEFDKLTSKVDSLEKKIQKSEKISSLDNKTDIFGYYKAGKLSTPRVACEQGDEEEETREILLLKNWTFKSVYASSCDGAEQSGTFSYENGKIVLVCDANSSQCPEGTTIEFSVNEDGTLSGGQYPSDFNSLNIYNKVMKDELQILK